MIELRRRSSRRLTLIELMVYMGLVTIGLLMIGTVQMASLRAAAMQQALLDIEDRSLSFLRGMRSDIEEARHVRYRAVDDTLEIERVDGRWVFYRNSERVERQEPDGPDLRRQLFGGRIESWTVEQTQILTPRGVRRPRYVIEITLMVPGHLERTPLRRVRRISAAPRLEVQGG